MPPASNGVVDTRTACEILNIDRVTFWRLRKKGHVVPLEHYSGRAVYARADIDALARRRATKTVL